MRNAGELASGRGSCHAFSTVELVAGRQGRTAAWVWEQRRSSGRGGWQLAMRDAEANLAREATYGWSWLLEMDLSGDWPAGENEEGRRRMLVDWLRDREGILRWKEVDVVSVVG